jgi:hypothetical protein
MNVGIYIPGLGENYKEEFVLKYATRFMHELDWNHKNAKNTYTLKHETIFLSNNSNKKELNKHKTTKVSIIEHEHGDDSIVYCFYDLPYESTLTEKYNSSSLFRKSILLLLTILRKFPQVFLGLFNKNNSEYFSQKKRVQSFYAIMLLIMVALGGVLLIPSFFTVFGDVDAVPSWISDAVKKFFDNKVWHGLSHYIIAASIIVFTILPKINSLIVSLTTKLVCIHYYLQLGERKQAIMGHLDNLLEFISEYECPDAAIHLHACDFGAILCYDMIFPGGTVASERARQKISCLCTISFPYEFISSYYPKYFSNRDAAMSIHLSHWYNVFASSDFFSTNFKGCSFKESIGDDSINVTLCNIQYDITGKETSIYDFIAFLSLQTHQYYWDDSTDGTSCLRLLVRAMIRDELI